MRSALHEGFFVIDLNEGDGISSPADCNLLSIQKIHNLDNEVTAKIAAGLGLVFINETEASGEVCFANEPGLRPEFRQSFTPVDLSDYIYAVLHNNNKYDEFLKAGLAQVPYPTSAEDFWKMVQTGNRLR